MEYYVTIDGVVVGTLLLSNYDAARELENSSAVKGNTIVLYSDK